MGMETSLILMFAQENVADIPNIDLDYHLRCNLCSFCHFYQCYNIFCNSAAIFVQNEWSAPNQRLLIDNQQLS